MEGRGAGKKIEGLEDEADFLVANVDEFGVVTTYSPSRPNLNDDGQKFTATFLRAIRGNKNSFPFFSVP